MQIGLGVDSRLGLSVAQLRDLGAEAAALGYESLWTNAGTDYDPVALCVAWAERTPLATGVSVVPLQRNPAAVLALAARSAHELSGGRFTLGVGSGTVTDRPVGAVGAYLREVRRVAPDVPLCVGALGPQMLRLAGRVAGAAALNWSTPAQIRWSREQAGPGARVLMYIRVCVDRDVAAARRALARQILAYALLRGGYRAHFARMGFEDDVAALERARAAGASDDAIADALPDRLVDALGYAGDGTGARERFAALAAGLDVAIVRVLSTRPGDVAPVRAAMAALAPRAA